MNYNVTIHTLMPFNPQYPRTNQTPASKKEDSHEKKISFQDVLKEKMSQK
ncbi:hypothetical protein OIN60_16185 [Paenibacillus sp. P96]|uniref:Uncharacterized protein n=1 Tax=Paenibacillus zeirhizosphaerae TaxID=2987519 RepID=A0ABT9FUB2_9BACL|nr:hypothetical protein [Paenibacillus sp. P96]MDP4098296.1 hypothetical protein [Paenibacillus sp. P96]